MNAEKKFVLISALSGIFEKKGDNFIELSWQNLLFCLFLFVFWLDSLVISDGLFSNYIKGDVSFFF